MGRAARRDVAAGMFGENLTTAGIDVNEAVLGEHWRIGTALLEPCEVRIPCNDFKSWMGRHGYDDAAWVKRFAESAARALPPGARGGRAQAGDEIEVEHRPEHGVTVVDDVPGADHRAGRCCRGCSTSRRCPSRSYDAAGRQRRRV